MNCRVYESGAGKWIKVVDEENGMGKKIQYTSNQSEAHLFSNFELVSANQLFSEFRVFWRTMRAVPVGTNHMPVACDTVRNYLKNIIEQDWQQSA